MEDRIKQLCAKAVTTPESPELNEILKQLQSALHEHNDRREGWSPVGTRTQNADPQHPKEYTGAQFCGKPIMLEQAKVTEGRKLVHGKCYVEMIEGK
jgi:hypothetical protein